MTGLLSNTVSKLRPSTLAKRLHRLTHAHPDEIIALCERAGHGSNELKIEIKKITDECRICAESGLPIPTKKISINHVNQAFNVEIQVEFMFCTRRTTKYLVLNITDCGTGYAEAVMTSDRNAETVVNTIEVEWLKRHGGPDALSGDDEFDSRHVRRFLSGRDIQFKVRPVRRHNKTGVVERKNGVIKSILEKLQKENTTGTDRTILSCAVFLANCFTGSKVLSSYELAKGYASSLQGAPKRLVFDELLNAYAEQAATLALKKALKARNRSKHIESFIKEGDEVLFFFKTTAQNVPDEWRTAVVVKTHKHVVEERRRQGGPISKVAYEDIRLRPNSELGRELSEGLMEDYIDLTLTPDSDEEVVISGSLMSSNAPTIEAVQKDMGEYAEELINEPNMTHNHDLSSSEQTILRWMQKVFGARQVSAGEVQFAPPWILEKAINKEHEDNWTDSYEEIYEKDVPHGANVISSQTVFKVKQDEDGKRKLKARLVTHGNRDDLKDEIRKDCSNADMIIVRLLISVALCLGFSFGVADIKGAFMQSEPIQRDIYVRPAPEFRTKRGVLLKLNKPPYGIVEAGRQWAKRIESWMLNDEGLTRVDGVNQLFFKRDEDRNIILAIAKIVDDLLVAGTDLLIETFMKRLQDEFEVGKVRIGKKLNFAGCDIIEDEDNNVLLTMTPYLDRLNAIEVSRARKRERHERVTAEEMRAYRSLSGTLMYLGSAVLPQAALVTSKMQQELGNLRVGHLVEANGMLQEICHLKPTIKYIRPFGVRSAILVSLSDASHGTNERAYGQTGVICRIKFTTSFDDQPIFHPLYWCSTKQRRATNSSFGAEILACPEAEDRGFDMKETLNGISTHCKISHHILVDSKALFDTITTLHECREFRLRKTVTMIRDAFESKELNMVTWIPGTLNIADALTKRSTKHSANMNNMLREGFWSIDIAKGKTHNSES